MFPLTLRARVSVLQYVRYMEKRTLWCAYWVGLGILSSVGLGTGLHTFLLYLVRKPCVFLRDRSPDAFPAQFLTCPCTLVPVPALKPSGWWRSDAGSKGVCLRRGCVVAKALIIRASL